MTNTKKIFEINKNTPYKLWLKKIVKEYAQKDAFYFLRKLPKNTLQTHTELKLKNIFDKRRFMREQKEKYWMGIPPKKCDITNEPIENIFIDGKTKMGPWAFMTPKSFLKFGIGLGTGKGQKYQKQANDKWLKIEG